MIEVTPWDEVFTEYKGTKKGIFTILYWYLFNKPDYLTNIASEMKKMEKSGAFENFPKVITHKNTIGKPLHEMEEYNLIGRCGPDDLRKYDLIEEKIGKTRRVYFQALSFFYIDFFCIKTPNSVKKQIEDHYEEYKGHIGDSKIAKYPYRTVFSFDSPRNAPILPVQEIVQGCSSRPEKFMKVISRGERDHIRLYELLIKTFEELESISKISSVVSFLNTHLEDKNKSLYTQSLIKEFERTFDILDGKKVLNRYKLAKEGALHDAVKILLRDPFEIKDTKKSVESLLELYKKVERGALSFNPKTWMFE